MCRCPNAWDVTVVVSYSFYSESFLQDVLRFLFEFLHVWGVLRQNFLIRRLQLGVFRLVTSPSTSDRASNDFLSILFHKSIDPCFPSSLRSFRLTEITMIYADSKDKTRSASFCLFLLSHKPWLWVEAFAVSSRPLCS